MSDTLGRAMVRVGKTLGVYALVAGLIWVAVPSVQRLFLLPQLFRPLVAAMLIFGVPVAVGIAWRYPRLGSEDPQQG